MKTLRREFSNGFSLVEVALAVGVASFCLATLLALLSVGIQHNQQANNESAMANLAGAVALDLQSAPAGTGTVVSPFYQLKVYPAGPISDALSPQIVYTDAAGSIVTTSSTPVYRICLAVLPPSAGLKSSTVVRIAISWPAQADASSATWPTRYTRIFQTNITLNRN